MRSAVPPMRSGTHCPVRADRRRRRNETVAPERRKGKPESLQFHVGIAFAGPCRAAVRANQDAYRTPVAVVQARLTPHCYAQFTINITETKELAGQSHPAHARLSHGGQVPHGPARISPPRDPALLLQKYHANLRKNLRPLQRSVAVLAFADLVPEPQP